MTHAFGDHTLGQADAVHIETDSHLALPVPSGALPDTLLERTSSAQKNFGACPAHPANRRSY